MSGLELSPRLTLPIEAVTETFAILAKRGAGKSNAAVVMAEQMHAVGLPWVAIDPKGDWWGIRSSRDGKGAGLPVLVLGGQHGDVPLEPTAGRLVADLIVEQRLTCVVDVSLMSKADARRFLADFAERLYQANADPLHVFAEEAHEYIPQRVAAGDARMVGAWEKLVKWGRTHGLGVTLITQRSASLNKDVLTQVETLIALRTTGPQDQAAIRAWVDEHDTGAAMLAQLRKLSNGEAFVLSPQWLELEEPFRVTFARRRTFDSGATPKAGEKRVAPRTLAEVDLAALKEAMAETIEKAKADDPKELRKRIGQLEASLREWIRHECPTAEPVVERVEVPVLPRETVEQLAAAARPLHELLSEIRGRLAELDYGSQEKAPGQPQPRRRGPIPVATREGRRQQPPIATLEKKPRETQPAPTDGPPLGKTERAVLTVLAQHGGSTHSQIALLAGYSPKASTIGVALSKLRKVGFVEPATQGQPAIATQDGIDWLGDPEPLPAGQALLDYWRNRFGKTERAVLDVVIDAWPGDTSHGEICEATGYSPSASTVGVALSKLRKVEVVAGWCLSDDFADAAGLMGARAS